MSRFSSPSRNFRRRRRGGLTIEFLLIFLMLLVAVLASFQFGIAMVIRQAISHSATVAAREAGKFADADELVEVVNQILCVHQLAVGDDVTVILEDPENLDEPVAVRGNVVCDPPANPVLIPHAVRVTVCVRIDSAPFYRALACYGIDFTGKHFQFSSVVLKEVNL
ncbi:MAG TPA: TadE family protein [Pirellulaceae bacterium]|nr:TadE family protein [Pirellulaceae bacterium]